MDNDEVKLVIAGSRDLSPHDLISRFAGKIDAKYGVTHVISGNATGVDKAGEFWAVEHGKEVIDMPADWDKYGKRAGPIRNMEMLKQADIILVILRDANSKGSSHMASISQKSGKPTYVYNAETKKGESFNI